MGTAIDLPAYAARLLVLASACSTGARIPAQREMARHHHRAQCRAYIFAVYELQERAQGVIEAAVVLLDEDAVRSPARGYELRAAQASKLARHLLANLRLGAERLYDGVDALYLDGEESRPLTSVADHADQAAAHGADVAMGSGRGAA